MADARMFKSGHPAKPCGGCLKYISPFDCPYCRVSAGELVGASFTGACHIGAGPVTLARAWLTKSKSAGREGGEAPGSPDAQSGMRERRPLSWWDEATPSRAREQRHDRPKWWLSRTVMTCASRLCCWLVETAHPPRAIPDFHSMID